MIGTSRLGKDQHGNIVARGAVTIEDYADFDFFEQLADVQGLNNLSAVPTFTNGVLTKVEELDGTTVKKRTTITYNSDGTVNTVTDMSKGKTVVTTLSYVNGEFSAASNVLLKGGL